MKSLIFVLILSAASVGSARDCLDFFEKYKEQITSACAASPESQECQLIARESSMSNTMGSCGGLMGLAFRNQSACEKVDGKKQEFVESMNTYLSTLEQKHTCKFY